MLRRARHALIFVCYELVTRQRPYSELRRLARLQWQPPAKIQAGLDAQLRPLLAHACAQVPHYRDLVAQSGLRPAQIEGAADLRLLPPLSRQALRAGFPDRMVASNLPARQGLLQRTSGSTGLPLEFFADRRAQARRLAAYLLAREWAGVPPGTTLLMITSPGHLGAGVGSSSRRVELGRRLLFGERYLNLSGLHTSAAALCACLAALPRRPGYFIWSFPSYLARLAAELAEQRLTLPRPPEVVLSYGESLTPLDAATISRAFGAPVVNQYTAWEAPHLAQSCPDNPALLHLLSDRAVLRVVRPDGQNAAAGEAGRLLLTDLTNYVMPLINYDLGDVATVGRPCRCGRGLPTLQAIEGRQHELIRLPSGRVVSPVTVGRQIAFACRAIPHVWEYQLVQTGPERLELRLVPTAAYTDQVGQQLAESLTALFEHQMRVSVRTVESIAPEPSGKRLLTKLEPRAEDLTDQALRSSQR
jgi:phenylacetate-CoA ligase